MLLQKAGPRGHMHAVTLYDRNHLIKWQVAGQPKINRHGSASVDGTHFVNRVLHDDASCVIIQQRAPGGVTFTCIAISARITSAINGRSDAIAMSRFSNTSCSPVTRSRFGPPAAGKNG